MKQGLLLLLQWRPPPQSPLLAASVLRIRRSPVASASPGGGGGGGELTARERRQLRNERRESSNWREEVEDQLLQKPKKRKGSWKEELNLDRLALLGPQWWVIRVGRVHAQETAGRVAQSLVRVFPTVAFKVYFPCIREKRKLKNGSFSTKLKPLFPGCVFLHCVMNKDIHDFIREYDGVGGFLGSKVGNTKRQMTKPKPVSIDEMEKIFRQAKEEQECYDQAFEEEQQQERSINSSVEPREDLKFTDDTKPKRRSRKVLETPRSTLGDDYKSLTPGASVRVLSGPFTEFTGRLKELNHKSGKATVKFMLFGEESFVDLEVDQVTVETTK